MQQRQWESTVLRRSNIAGIELKQIYKQRRGKMNHMTKITTVENALNYTVVECNIAEENKPDTLCVGIFNNSTKE